MPAKAGIRFLALGPPPSRGRADVVSDGERMTGRQDSEEIASIRAAVRALCADFPGEYWRKLDRERAYPTEFVDALTKAGFLAALIPEEYGEKSRFRQCIDKFC